ncbi:MAG TPA: DUF1553 domain-containing protein [Pirellulales bacterium]|nr:DUF1553 domain-containing protein [Pirellulales bacterium]
MATNAAWKSCTVRLLVAMYCLGFFALVQDSIAADAPTSASAAYFDREVAPLLSRRCLDCHNPTDKKGGLDLTNATAAKSGGDSGPAIEPGKPDDSLLWSRVAADEMPPKHPLPAAERKLLHDWIAAGAAWGTDAIDRFRYSSDTRAGYDWWALSPIVRPAVPELMAGEVSSPCAIDQLVRPELARHNLHPAPEADRRTLIRRVTFDLTGLPPTPEEIDVFFNDAGDGAYERVVDRLLASPQYGVRWARHWLDVVRFGESNGFEYDELRPQAWPYRDWVVRALNDDLPYDEFVRMQLAGDCLRPHDLDATIATGFLTAGAYDTAGQNQQSAAMRAVVRQDELEDLVGTVAQTFLGLTVNCARCHDHKFDPIRQSEYYALASALSGVRHGNQELAGLSLAGKRAAELAGLEARRQKLESELAALEHPARARILAKRRAQPVELRPLAAWDFRQDRLEQTAGWEIELHGAARLTSAGLELNGDDAFATTGRSSQDLRAKTLEVWVRLANVKQSGGAAIGVQSLDGGVFDSIVFGEREPRQWMAGSDNYVRTQSFHAAEEIAPSNELVHMCLTYAEDGTVSAFRNREPYGRPYRTSAVATFPARKSQIVFGLRHAPAAPGKMLSGLIERAHLYDRALSADEVASGVDHTVTSAMIRQELGTDDLAHYEGVQADLASTNAAIAALRPTSVYANKPREPEPTRLLARGNPAQPKDVVAPGGIAAVGSLPADFGLAADAPESERRLRLANWITDARNPLFARVIVNRLWHYHFGVGLVDTPNDFGFNGGRPTNQALVDWLAAEMIAGGYHLKPIHRLIVTSATYRQASSLDAAAMKVDADNRLLWRHAPQRLEAEAVRDTMLHVAGALNLSLDGPGFQEMKATIAPGTNTFLYAPDDPTKAIFKRRTLYRVWARSGRSALLDVLDCPDPSTTSPKRAVTTTPLQALSLLNNAFVLHVADKFAERVERDAGAEPARQVARVYQLAYGRLPAEDEQKIAIRVVREHGLGALARAIFNSNEFVYVD